MPRAMWEADDSNNLGRSSEGVNSWRLTLEREEKEWQPHFKSHQGLASDPSFSIGEWHDTESIARLAAMRSLKLDRL